MIRPRNTTRGTIPGYKIIEAYRRAFCYPWWLFGRAFHLADKYYKEADVALILSILSKDRTDLEEYVAEDYDCEVPIETAYALGLFFADGSCGLRNGHYAGANWRITGWKVDCLKRAQVALAEQYPDMVFPLRLFDSYRAGYFVSSSPFKDKERKKTLYCLEAAPKVKTNDGCRGRFIERFRNTIYNQFGEKKVPAGILESPAISKKAFLDGVFDGDGSSIKNYHNGGRIDCHGIMQTTELVDLMFDCGWKFSVGRDNRSNENYYILFNRKYEKLAAMPACDDFAFRLMGVFHQNRETAAMPIFITWVLTPQGGHAVLSCYVTGRIRIIEPQTDDISSVPAGWKLMLLCG